MKTISIMLLMMVSPVMTTRAEESEWREKTPAELKEWFRNQENLEPGGAERVLGKADEEKARTLTEPQRFDVARIYKLADGHQLELSYKKIEDSVVQGGSLVLREYGVWKVDAAGVRTEVWKTEKPFFNIRPVRTEVIEYRAPEPKSKGDVPEKMYKIKDGAVG